ncbi:uncharacterized protein [Triticum aestivum]|uniref:uncharacterized protein n=1 Tax=Triticum aestivum TaxID=4565 RepID=UPI001D023041|nr:uncharacterized protein LOC123090074 [Triticum aestivum]
MDEISEELEALQTELTVLGLKEDKMQDQIDQVNTRLQIVESLEKQLGKVELLVENNSKVQQDIFAILREMRAEKPPSPVPQASASLVVQPSIQPQTQPDPGATTANSTGETLTTPQGQQTQLLNSLTGRNVSQQTPPVVITAMQHQTDRAMQFLKSISKGPKIDFPTFSGDNPLGWIRQVNKYFQLAQIPDECKVDLALTYIVGRADNWVRSARMENNRLPWPDFCRALCDRFAESSIYEILEKFHSLKQNTMSVAAYTDKFEEVMAVVRDEHPYLQENYYIVSFVNGLKPSIRCNLRPQRPTTLSQAYWLARDYESGLQAKYLSYINHQEKQSQTHSGQSKTTILPAPNLQIPPPAAAIRKPGVCWRCNGPWVPGHKCKQSPALHAIVSENEPKDMSPEEEAQLAVLTAEWQFTELIDKCMHISAQAVSGDSSESTIAVSIFLGGKKGVALIDTGSTNTFIDLKFSLKANCQLVNTPTQKVTVAGGGSLNSGAVAPNTNFKIYNEDFSNDLTVLDFQGYDIVLGCDFLKKHSPLSMDFDARTATINKDKTQSVTFADCTVAQPPKLISAEKAEKLCSQGAVGFAMSLQFMTQVSNYSCISTQPEPKITEEPLPVLEQYKELFTEPTNLPPTRECDHTIPLKEDTTPPNVRPYRVPHLQKNEMEQQIQLLLSRHIIQHSMSPYASPAILVRKKGGTWILCIDYRKLNAQTVKNKFPIPVIEDLLDELHGAAIFSKLDLRSGYHQIRMKTEDVHKTAFRTYSGHFEFLVMPFGLTNAPATFQALMNKIFAPYLRKFVLVFFDDILIFSKTPEEHKEHLALVMELLKKHQLFLNQAKCTFGTPTVEYLGHVLSAQGVATDPDKISAIKQWPIPSTTTELRSFLDLAGYYRRFIKDCGLICRPLHDLLKKDAFLWPPYKQKLLRN